MPAGVQLPIFELISVFAGLLILVTWVGYPLLISCLRGPQRVWAGESRWRVTVLVAAWNTGREIGRRVRNLADQTYPAELLRIYVASDGSTDATIPEALKAAPGRVTAKQFPRGGKSATQTAAMADISDEIIVLSDTDTRFASDCVMQLLAPFSDPNVGCVTGAIVARDGSRPLSNDQGLYWKYENWLRLGESDSGILVTAAGPCMAFRRKLFKPLEPARGDDCMIPLDVVLQGYRVVHTPLAIAYDTFPSTLRGELRARMRMTTRNLAGFFDRPALLNPFRHPGYALSLWLHKIFRWMTPFFAIALWLSSMAAPKRNLFLLMPQVAFLLLVMLAVCFCAAGEVGQLALRLPPSVSSWRTWALRCGRFNGFLAGKETTTYTNIDDSAPPVSAPNASAGDTRP